MSDDAFTQAVMLVWEHNNASTSFLQRRLGIGYNAAARLIERMEEMGIVSAPDHVGKREVRRPEDLKQALDIKAMAERIMGSPEDAKDLIAAIIEETKGKPFQTPDILANTTMTIQTPDGPKTMPFDADKLTAAISAGFDKEKKRVAPSTGHNSGDSSDPYAVTADELRQFIERFEQLESEKKEVTESQKELMAEAKGRGYDTKVMRKVIAMRKRKPDELAEEEAVLEIYKTALGMT